MAGVGSVTNGVQFTMLTVCDSMVSTTDTDQTEAENLTLVGKQTTAASEKQTSDLAAIEKQIEAIDPSSKDASTQMQKLTTEYNYTNTKDQMPIDTLNTQTQTDASGVQQVANANNNLGNVANQDMGVMSTLTTVLASPF